MSLATLAFKDRLASVYRKEAARSKKNRAYCLRMAERYDAAAPKREALRAEIVASLPRSEEVRS